MPDYPLIDTSMSEATFLYPVGSVISEPPPAQPVQLGAYGYHSSTSTGPQRSRSLSNATMATADVRLTMKRSITDLFSSIGEIREGEVLLK